MKHFLFLLAILLFFESHAQTRSFEDQAQMPSNVMGDLHSPP